VVGRVLGLAEERREAERLGVVEALHCEVVEALVTETAGVEGDAGDVARVGDRRRARGWGPGGRRGGGAGRCRGRSRRGSAAARGKQKGCRRAEREQPSG